MRLSSIHTYPVKGCHRIDHQSVAVQPWGLAGDRRWLVADDEGRMLTQREEPAMTQVLPSIVDGSLLLRAEGRPDLTVPALAADELTEVLVGRTRVGLSPAGEDADAWLSAALNRKVRLYHLDDPTRRPVNPDYSVSTDRVSLADGYPLLLTNSASLAALNDWVAEESPQEWPLPMTRFRPSVVVEGAPAWAEDGWLGGRLRIGRRTLTGAGSASVAGRRTLTGAGSASVAGGVTFRAPKPCDRCVVTTTDQESGARGREPLRTLGKHRNIGRKLLFGLNLIPDGTGELRVGDEVEVV
jgi:uncharacterized protein